jgi:hypothetical protein
VLGYRRLDDLCLQRPELGQRSRLVLADEFRITHHIGHQYRGEAALLGHSGRPALRRSSAKGSASLRSTYGALASQVERENAGSMRQG